MERPKQHLQTSETEISYKRNFHVKKISLVEAKLLVSKFHYLGNKNFMSSVCYGLCDNLSNDLVGVAVFGVVGGIQALKSWFGLSNQVEGIFELTRLVMAPEHNGKNGTSFLLGRALRLLKKTGAKGVISLADSEHHVGFIYQSCNFKYYGLTDYKTDFYDVSGKLNPRGATKNKEGAWISRTRKHRYYFGFDSTLKVCHTEQSYPKHSEVNKSCCNKTNKIYDKRFNKYYECPKCNFNFFQSRGLTEIEGMQKM